MYSNDMSELLIDDVHVLEFHTRLFSWPLPSLYS